MHATKKILFSLFNITVAVALLVFLFKSSPVKTNAQASHPNTCGTYAAVTGISPSGNIGAGPVTIRWNPVKNTSGAVITGNVWYHVEVNDTTTAANPDYSVETGIGATGAGPYTVTAGHNYVIAVWGRGGCGYGPVATVNASVAAAVPLNCYNVSGPTSITLGQSATYSADFTSPNMGALVGYGANGSWIGPWPPRYPGGTSYSGSWTITPTSVGQYNVACRVWNDSIAECDGPNGWGIQSCPGPRSNLTLTVNPAPVAGTPTGLAAACNPTNAVFAWNTSPNATSYNLTTVVNRVQTSRTLNVTSFSLPFTSTSTINWWVTASNQYNTSPQATGATLTCSPPQSPPAAPSNITITPLSGSLYVQWTDNSTNETGFQVESYNGSSFTNLGATQANWTNVNDTSKSCPANNGIQYRITANSSAGNVSAMSAKLVCPPSVPSAPSNVTNTASSATAAVVVKWSDTSSNETGFYIYDGTTLTGQVGAGVTTFTDNANCPAQNGHKYAVQSFNSAGSSARISAAATVACPAAPPPALPAAPSAVTVSASTPTGAVGVKWTDNSNNETGFNIYDGTTLTGSVSGNVTTFTDNVNCPAQNGHKYSVEAFNAGGKSAKAVSAALVCPVAAPTIPAAPSSVTISASSATGPVTVKWKDNSTNETGFNIYDGTTLTGTVSSNIVTFTDNLSCPAQNGHKYSIEAYNTAGKSAKAVSAALVCPTATATAPTAPSNVTVSAANATAPAVITWKDNSNNETGFNIYDGTTLTGSVNANTTTFTDNSNCPGQNGHKYSVEAVNGSTPSTKATSAALVCPAATPAPPTAPLAPSNVTISVPTATSPVTVNWKDNAINETGFNIYDGTTKKGTVTANKVTFTDTAACPAQNGKKYGVEAYNGSGTSARVTATVSCPAAPAPTVPNPPTTVKATPSNPTVSAVTISWTNPTGTVQGSYVYEKTNGGAAVLVAQLTAAVTSFVDSSPGCPAGGTIQYQVQVYNSSGNSAKASSNTITCPGPAVQPAPDATSGSLKPASGSVGNVTVNSLLPKIITVDGSVTLAPVGGQSSVAYIETQTTVLQPIPGPTQVEQTPVQNSDNYAIPLVWPGFTPPVTKVRVDYALIGANGTVLYSNSVIYTQIGSGPGYTPTIPSEPGPMPPGLNTIKQIGQFKTIPTATNNFNDMKNLELNKDYWVRLTIAGDTAPPTFNAFGPSDIMLVLDITGSMDSKFYTDSSHTNSVTKLQGAKAALSTFVDNADPQDYLGFGTFRICRNLYDKSKAPLIWTYEGMSSFYRKTTGFSALHLPLQSLASNTAAIKSQFKNTINGITYDFCLKSSGTDIGAGITLGTTQLTDILDDPKSLRPDGTPYKVSSVGTYTKNASRGGSVPKYIVIATDGQENSSPRFLEPDMDGSTDTVQSAKKRGVKIYTLAIGHDADAYGADMQFIANATGGKYYPGRTQQELSNAYLGILQNIQGNGAGGKIVVNEKINNINFDTVVPSKGFPNSNFDFKLTKFDPTTGGETDVTATACDKLSCLSGSSTDGMNVTLPYFTDKERYYIYFKAHAKQAGTNVNVDSSTSQVVYPSGVTVLANTKVNINGLDAYFVAEGGDVYSHSSSFTPIKSDLPLNTFFVTEDEPVVFYTGPQTAQNNNSANLDLGDGQLSPTNREIKGYTVTNGMSYNSLYEKVKDVVQKISITNSNVFAPTAGEVGYYMTDSATGDLTIGGPGWDRGPIKDKNIVVFVPGDLYINDSNSGKPFSIASDGRSVVSFVVRGRIGIDPSVTNMQGIYLADGIIDTACNVGIGADGMCSPDLKDAPLGSSLTVEGMMYSINGGFNLHRQGTPGVTPGEKFIFRPDFFMNAIVALGHNESTFRECILINCSR